MIKLETLNLCRYDENKHSSLKRSFENESKSNFIHNVSDRLSNFSNCKDFSFQSAYVVLENNVPIGYVFISNMFNDEVFLELSVLKEFRGMGKAKKIINEVCDYLFVNHNIRVVKLDIDPSNKNSILAAQACDFLFDEEEYESRGFTGKMVFYKESLCYESKRRRAK